MKPLVLTFLLLNSACILAQDVKSIHVATDVWDRYTHADGSGLYFDILRLVYEPQGIDVKYTITPYKRSVLLVTSKQLDAWVASYKGEETDVIYPEIILGYDEVVALFKKTTFPNWEGEASLKNRTLAWIRGYGYENYLKVDTQWRELNEREQVIPMLERDRVDAFLDHIEDVQALVDRSPRIERNTYRTGLVFRLDLYMGFANTPKGQALADLWDERMQQIIASGELKSLWEKKSGTPFPFEQ